MRPGLMCLVWLVATTTVFAADYTVRGMVVRVEPDTRRIVVSHDRIQGLMDSMTMPFQVRDVQELEDVVPGSMVEFTLVVNERGGFATAINVAAGRGTPPSGVVVGQPAPAVTVTDGQKRRVALSSLRGKVVVMGFGSIGCIRAHDCARESDAFSALRQRFQSQFGGDLAFLPVPFDAARAGSWLNRAFGMAVFDRQGNLAGQVDSERATAQQMGDLVLDVLTRPR